MDCKSALQEPDCANFKLKLFQTKQEAIDQPICWPRNIQDRPHNRKRLNEYPSKLYSSSQILISYINQGFNMQKDP